MRIFQLIRQKLLSCSITKFIWLIYKEIKIKILGVKGFQTVTLLKDLLCSSTTHHLPFFTIYFLPKQRHNPVFDFFFCTISTWKLTHGIAN